MHDQEIVLCGSSAYSRKFFLNDDFSKLPLHIRQELQIMCVLFTEDVGGIVQLVFGSDGNLSIRTQAKEDDMLYDEIGSALKIRQLQREKKELFEALETYYKVMA